VRRPGRTPGTRQAGRDLPLGEMVDEAVALADELLIDGK
jgi:hypothetical protein